MSYEPNILIKKEDLDNALPLIRSEINKPKQMLKTVYEYVYELKNIKPVDFEGKKIIICSPKTTSFNEKVRWVLRDLGIYYSINLMSKK